jgi:5'-3' exonuclease
MGIPSYFSYIVRNHADIIKKFDSSTIQIHNLYLDCNSVIYDIIHETDFTKIDVKNTEYIINKVCVKIKSYINLLNPSNNVFIAFDGVAPVAKLEQQRNRRYKSWYQSMITSQIYGSDPKIQWDTTAITPGTSFMKLLSDTIYKTFTEDSNIKYLKNLIISCSDFAGEGEHKLFEYIRNYPDQHNSFNTVIYGLDADLIMLSINHLPIAPNIFLYRETPHFIKSINSELEPNESYMIDIPELTQTIINDMNNNEPLNTLQQQNRIYDYIFLCFFLGNDFMPHFPSCNIRTGGIHKLLSAYKETLGSRNENLTNGTKIYWKNVRKLVAYMAEKEQYNLRGEHIKRDRTEKKQLSNVTNDDKYELFNVSPCYQRENEKPINPFKPNWEERYYKQLFNIEPEDLSKSAKQKICVNFMEGLEWTMKYYTTGCANWKWSYKYHYPPLFSDLIKFMPVFDKEFITQMPKQPVKDITQLAYVLPKHSLYLLSKSIYNKLKTQHPEWYIDNCDFKWAYCRYFWESHVELPEINIDTLESVLYTFEDLKWHG